MNLAGQRFLGIAGMTWITAMWTLLLGCAFLLCGEVPRVEALRPCNLLSDPSFEFYPYKDKGSIWIPGR